MVDIKPGDDGRVRIGEAITLEVLTGVTGILRCLTDPSKSPGDVEWTCVFVIDENNECTIKVMNNIRRVPTGSETKQMIKYFRSLGCHGGWVRCPNGKKHKTIKL